MTLTFDTREIQPVNSEDQLESVNNINGSISESSDLFGAVFNRFHSVVDSSAFYKAAESILTNIEQPKYLAKCAGLASLREPGGTFYRAKLWAKINELLPSENQANKKELTFGQLCKQVSVHPTTAKGYVTQGKAIESVEKASISTIHLREAPTELFKYAQRQKERAGEYLIEAAKFINNKPNATLTQIHREWCLKNGSRSANLDIIKPSDWWAFGNPKWRKEDNFPGSIPGEIYANALYYFAPKVGIAVDPMAGSGMFKRVYDDRERWQKDSSFDLKIHLFDLHPCRDFIKKHDARNPLPIKADWIFIDPPYFAQSKHLFDGDLAAAKDYSEYLTLMQEVIKAMSISLNPAGRLCIFLPKWSGLRPENPNHDIPADVHSFAINEGLIWIDAAFVSRGRQQEPASAVKNNAAKRARRMRSDTCVLNVFEKSGVENVEHI
jgi:hypothetical protein